MPRIPDQNRESFSGSVMFSMDLRPCVIKYTEEGRASGIVPRITFQSAKFVLHIQNGAEIHVEEGLPQIKSAVKRRFKNEVQQRR